MRILIVGAGPTGLTAAVELWRRGIKAKIIDRRDGGSAFSRAVGITPRSLELLEPSGVTERLVVEGIKFKKARFYRVTSQILELPIKVNRIQHGYDYLLGLAQDRTEAHLRSALEEFGGKVEYSSELVDLSQDGDKVTVQTEGKRKASFDYVIGADGIHSTTRNLVGINFDGYELPETWSIADVESDDWMNPGVFTICQLEEGKVVVVVPLEVARYRVISSTEDALKVLPLPMNIKKIRREGTFTISVRQVNVYQKGRVFLAGDAAHCHSPVGGRGMNLGIADGADLAQRFATGGLEGYTAARHPDGAKVIAGSERVRKLVMSSNPFARALVLTVLKTLGAAPALQRRFCEVLLYG